MLAHEHKSGTGTGVEPVTPLNTRAEHIVLVSQHSDQTLLKSFAEITLLSYELETVRKFPSRAEEGPCPTKPLYLLSNVYVYVAMETW